MTSGDRLRLFCNAKYGTDKGAITAFANDVRMKASNLHKYFGTERAPGKKVLARLAGVGCNVHWLVTGEGEMYSDTEAGIEVRDRTRKTVVAESFVYSTQHVQDWKRSVEQELAEIRVDLASVAQSERDRRQERIIELLEMKAEMLAQENLVQAGQIIAYERMIGALGAGGGAAGGTAKISATQGGTAQGGVVQSGA